MEKEENKEKTAKETNLGAKYDQGKLRYSLLDYKFLEGIVKVREYGVNKYKDENSWKAVPEAKKRYTDAMLRHLFAYLGGEEEDPESGLNHMDHVGCNLMFLNYFRDKTVAVKEPLTGRVVWRTCSITRDVGSPIFQYSLQDVPTEEVGRVTAEEPKEDVELTEEEETDVLRAVYQVQQKKSKCGNCGDLLSANNVVRESVLTGKVKVVAMKCRNCGESAYAFPVGGQQVEPIQAMADCIQLEYNKKEAQLVVAATNKLITEDRECQYCHRKVNKSGFVYSRLEVVPVRNVSVSICCGVCRRLITTVQVYHKGSADLINKNV